MEIESLSLHSIKQIERAIATHARPQIDLVGSDSLVSLALVLSQANQSGGLKDKTHLALVDTDKKAEDLIRSINFFDPTIKVYRLPPFDVDPYSGLYPNHIKVADRLKWLSQAQNARHGDIFVASIEALMQLTLPFEPLQKMTRTVATGDSLGSDISEYLQALGYQSSPLVEDVGSFSVRGGIVDIYSPSQDLPVRFELFGDIVDSIRLFDPDTQRSLDNVTQARLIPAREILFIEEDRQATIARFNSALSERNVDPQELQEIRRSLVQQQYFPGIEFYLPYFYERPASPLEHFSCPLLCWRLNPLEIARQADETAAELKNGFNETQDSLLSVNWERLYQKHDQHELPPDSTSIHMSKIAIEDAPDVDHEHTELRAQPVDDFRKGIQQKQAQPDHLSTFINDKVSSWRQQGSAIFVASHTRSSADRLRLLLESAGQAPQLVGDKDYCWDQWLHEQRDDLKKIHILPRALPQSVRIPSEDLVFLRDDDFFGARKHSRATGKTSDQQSRAKALNFGELKVGDLIVHKLHGVGHYKGLKVMPIQGVEAEYLELEYKGGDKLFMPVYRIGQIQKYSGPGSARIVDKLGGTGWEKAKTKVKGRLRDMAAELLKLYAERSQSTRPHFSAPDEDFIAFENKFPYDETDDQLRAINDVISDMSAKDTPMDRLICGDVGFGKTEVALRGAFKAVQDGKQVAIIAPTTILTFQHFENFKKRFADWPITIRALNRFVPKAEQKKTVQEMKDGKVDIVIGTHRLFSKDIGFKQLGLLVVDEEQKFGVKHKEKIRKLKVSVDTIAMSATPIPRTLNLSLMGVRDLSLISTPPVDRLPTRTFVCRFERETIRKAIQSEIKRGGQVFFIHNRIHSIEAVSAELREILPDIRMKIAHGQMEEDRLEQTMLEFFDHKIDVLVCTAIVESGMDIPRANTMFIDNAQQFGLSQLYQLRGRVGRSKERAYCYLLVPRNRNLDGQAQERLKVIQENTALGSGIRVAQYDLELRGAGDFLGQEQSGHINAVGYELFLELLEDAVREQKGEPAKADAVDPEINVRIEALIPDRYIPDIRVRLAYYKALSEIEDESDLDRIEEDLRDQFGSPPESVLNLMGLMLIRKVCKDLGVKDLSSGKDSITLLFSEQTALPTQKVVELSTRENKKYLITPESRLKIRIKEITWPRIYEELKHLMRLCP